MRRLGFHEELTSLGCYLRGFFFFFFGWGWGEVKLEDLDIFVCILVTDCCFNSYTVSQSFFLKEK